ncbi:thioredoxin family protein [Ralstonia sp. 11b]|uniref:thioredoxin family protein n=1 Tax=Ralstonia sp. 11b TaxID=3063544 RepID=UPI0028700D4C|nr:thioredoxin family protein [Ralstonia sp. 11b]MDR9384179.1 thioredoxin family protein [Ralstonia sp. 11b]
MNMLRACIAITLVASASLAVAGEIKPYTPQAFDQLTHAGKPVVVEVSASWCPTCKAQKPIVEGLMKQPAYRDVTVLTVDFDSDKAALKTFKVNMQSTFVAFKGATEVGRSVGDTTPFGIESLIRKTVN